MHTHFNGRLTLESFRSIPLGRGFSYAYALETSSRTIAMILYNKKPKGCLMRSSRIWHALSCIAGIAGHLLCLSAEYLRALEEHLGGKATALPPELFLLLRERTHWKSKHHTASRLHSDHPPAIRCIRPTNPILLSKRLL